MKIKMNLELKNVGKFCAICCQKNFDINVMNGRTCVDGKSVLGVMGICGGVVTIAPVTDDEFKIEEFFRQIQPFGAYKTEDF